MDSKVIYLNPNQLADMSRYKIDDVAPITFALITVEKNRYFFPSIFIFPKQAKSTTKGDMLTSRPTWIIYLDGDTPEKPSYVFTKKILTGYQEPIFILIVDNTPKALTKYYKNYNGESYFHKTYFAFTSESFIKAFDNIITAADINYDPNAAQTYLSFYIYDNPEKIPIIDCYVNTTPESDNEEIAKSITADLNHNTGTKSIEKSAFSFRNDTIADEYPVFKPRKITQDSGFNTKESISTPKRFDAKLIKMLEKISNQLQMQQSEPIYKHLPKDNKVHFSASAKRTIPNSSETYQKIVQQNNSLPNYEPMEIEEDWHEENQNQSQGFDFETPNPNKTSNYYERQQNINNNNNNTFEDLSSEEEYNQQPQSTKRYSFRIVSDPNDKNNNNNNNGGFDLN